ncbi:hypothetical protein GCM10010275_69380 [Streptomyces litmocidini]|nr:hypothetical protein GCM10010275_69380 [Streptomyces litmocidini]
MPGVQVLAVLLGGTTVATIVGVPGGALLGAYAGWRAAFWVVAALCAAAALGILRGVPAEAMKAEQGSLRANFRVLREPRLVRVLVLAALVNAATFGAFTFLAPVVTDPAGLTASWVSVALVLFGAGSFARVTLAGRLADRLLAVGGPLSPIGWVVLAALADCPAALLGLLLVQGRCRSLSAARSSLGSCTRRPARPRSPGRTPRRAQRRGRCRRHWCSTRRRGHSG